jgi:hypothetical protein
MSSETGLEGESSDLRSSAMVKRSKGTKRGNSHFTNPVLIQPPPAMPTYFDEVVETLGLKPEQYLQSVSLREWARKNKSCRYVPSDLLRGWGLVHDEGF